MGEAVDEADVVSDGVADVVALRDGVSVPETLCERVVLVVIVAEALTENDRLDVGDDDALAEGEGGGAESAAISVALSARE